MPKRYLVSRLDLLACACWLLCACGLSDTQQASVATSTLAVPTSGATVTQMPSVTPVVSPATQTPVSALIPPAPTSLTTPLPAEETEAAASIATSDARTVATDIARIPPTAAIPLAEAAQSLGPHTLLYTDPNRFLHLVDVDTGNRVWITVPGPTNRCNTVNDGANQSGEWSADGQYIAVFCDDHEKGSAALYTMRTGTLQDVSLVDNPTAEPVDQNAGSWSPTSAHYILSTTNWVTGAAQHVIVDATTGERRQLALPKDTWSFVWSPRGDRLAVIAREANDTPWQLLIVESDGQVRTVLDAVPGDRMPDRPRIPVWTPDGNAVFSLHLGASSAVETVRVAVDSATATVVASNRLSVQYSPRRAMVSCSRLSGARYSYRILAVTSR